MKNQIVTAALACLCLLFGSYEKEPEFVTDNQYLSYNGIEDVKAVMATAETDDGLFYFCNRQGKDWFARFDEGTKALEEEWWGRVRKYGGNKSNKGIVYANYNAITNKHKDYSNAWYLELSYDEEFESLFVYL